MLAIDAKHSFASVLKRLYFQVIWICALSVIQFINFLCFWHNRYHKTFEFKSNFLSSCGRNIRFKGTVWVAFHGVSKDLFSAFLRFCYYSYLNKNFEIVSKKMKIFEFGQIFFAFMLGIIAIESFISAAFRAISKAKCYAFLRVST